MKKENKIKNKSGQKAYLLIKEMINSLQHDLNAEIILSDKYSIGYPEQEKQFKMDFKLSFPNINNETWLLKSTNSIRERIYGTEFFAHHIRKIDKNVSKIYVVVPDSISEKELRNKDNYSKKITGGKYTSSITDVITVGELRKLIVEYCFQDLSQGIRLNILGADAEQEVLRSLNCRDNLELWNDYETNKHDLKSSNFDIFKEILTKSNLRMGIDVLDVVRATDNIPLLVNGGKPKTDVAVMIKSSKFNIQRTISIKNTSSKKVTVHEGDVSDLIAALNISNDSRLAIALSKFQECGSELRLGELYPDMVEVLHSELKNYNVELTLFFLFGTNSPLVVHPIQVADMILYVDKLYAENQESYVINYVSMFGDRGQFGTPFSWTYPSKRRGQRIQIKGFTNN